MPLQKLGKNNSAPTFIEILDLKNIGPEPPLTHLVRTDWYFNMAAAHICRCHN